MIKAQQKVIETAFNGIFNDLQTYLSQLYLKRITTSEEADFNKYYGQKEAVFQQIDSEISINQAGKRKLG